MKKRFGVLSVLAATALFSGWSYGEIDAPALFPSGFASLRLGQIVKGQKETVVGKDAKSDHVWVQEMNVGLSLDSKFKNVPATAKIGLEISVCNDNSPVENDGGLSRRLNFYPFLSRADLVFNLKENDNINLMIDAGYFPFKYNASVRNLGEYLFRTGTYPQYIVTDVDFPMARLMGVRFGGIVRKVFSFDILLTVNTEWTAIGDVNLSGLIAWKPHPLFELGLGGSWCSIISVDWDKTTPVTEGTKYLDRIPGTNDTAIYNYTFAGQKLMGRLTLDLKKILPWKGIFGEEDLKLYSESAILGLINYPVSMDGYTRYDTLWQRIPIMGGFNIPTFKLMDVLNIEIEWFGNPYVNNLNPIKFDNQPVTLSSLQNEKSSKYMNLHDDDWKWSVYGKKTFANHFFIKAQFASDHIRWFRLDYTKMDGKEALRKIDDWYYTVKFGYAF